MSLNTDKSATGCRKLGVQNLWADLWITLTLEYSACRTRSALIRVRRKTGCPRAETWPGVKGCSWCVSPARASPFRNQLMGRAAVKHVGSWPLYAFTREQLQNHTATRWEKGCSKPCGCVLWPQYYDGNTIDTQTILCWGDVLMYCQHDYFNIYGVFCLPLAYEQGAKETGQTYRGVRGTEPVPSASA